jgi:hypothetical protein
MRAVDANISKRTKSDAKRAAKDRGAEVVYEDDRWLVVVPKTLKASMMYGAGTKWCTTMKSGGFFTDYKKKGIKLYYILDKQKANDPDDKLYKMAVAMYPKQEGSDGEPNVECFDALDKYLGFDEIIEMTGIDQKIFVGNILKMPKTKRQIETWLKSYVKGTVKVNEDRSVDVDGDVSFYLYDLDSIPVKFNEVTGSFIIMKCDSIKDISNGPRKVGGNYSIHECKSLHSIKGAPEEVGRAVSLSVLYGFNSLEGFPKVVGGDIDINISTIKSLVGLPQKIKNLTVVGGIFPDLTGVPEIIDGDFNLSGPHVKSLKNCPRIVKGSFSIAYVNVPNMEGGPEMVGRDYTINSDHRMTNLKGCPEIILGNFVINDLTLDSFEGSPRLVGGELFMKRTEPRTTEGSNFELVFGINMESYDLQGSRLEIWMPFMKKVRLGAYDAIWGRRLKDIQGSEEQTTLDRSKDAEFDAYKTKVQSA